ncbi:hypothetical protein [Amycolatopsis methanolica]|uniref:Uncharacterized protein n=1 Tax=Amycolatopsis methanolica 239 TaxID=1068978 RepID=A0A076N367_AMYME|nr:hypothetical protein [Amycolatopsis methanolica]AIJ25576.1 hypothetical protein AMETH_5484 [Amycolatopsis methanolica 239]
MRAGYDRVDRWRQDCARLAAEHRGILDALEAGARLAAEYVTAHISRF